MEDNLKLIQARRTAFVARFIVLRELRRAKAHRTIEVMEWEAHTTAEELYEKFYKAFQESKDNLSQAKSDLKKAMEHVQNSFYHFVNEYSQRATLNFVAALQDFDYSNKLLFGDDLPKNVAWRNPQEIQKELIKQQLVQKTAEE